MKSVAIIGGGFAGLSAGVALADRGIPITLLEARPQLGGRAYSFEDQESGATVDNGQHAMMGCYTETLAFLAQIGATNKLVRQANLHIEMLHPQLGTGRIACPPLPAPLHTLVGILRYRLLRRRERVQALAAGLRLMTSRRNHDTRLAEWTVEEALVALGQSTSTRVNFWYPVAIATLNESPMRAAAAPFVEVLAQAFFRTRSASQFVLPKVGLSELYTSDARNFIEARGGRVELKAAVATMTLSDDHVVSLTLRDGRCVEVAAVVSSVPPRNLNQVLPLTLQRQAPFDRLSELRTSPIVSTHLCFDRPVLSTDFVGLLDTTTHWVFNRSKLTAQNNGNGQQFVSAVISAGHEVVDWDTDRIGRTVLRDIQTCLPVARLATVRSITVVKEKHATMSPTPAAERLRPRTHTPLSNFFLAGDWTDTGLPPTIESAVISGRRAAKLVAERGPL